MISKISSDLILCVSEQLTVERTVGYVTDACTCAEQRDLIETGYTSNENKVELATVSLDRCVEIVDSLTDFTEKLLIAEVSVQRAVIFINQQNN